MCGIAGLNGTFSAVSLTAMTDAIAHRGPDASGYLLEPEQGIGLGHRRLSILDVSPLGNQPMTSADGRYTIVYNGEIYNFRELRQELDLMGVKLRSHSDTEVLLELYARRGADVVSKLNGIFAFAIWDRTSRELTLFRDRRGTKPLYYAMTKDSFAFASERSACGGGIDIATHRWVTRDTSEFFELKFAGHEHVAPIPPGAIERVRCTVRVYQCARE